MASHRVRRVVLLALAGMLLFVGALAFASWLAVRTWGPSLAREQLETALSTALERPVRVASLSLEPWLGRAVVTGVAVEARPGERDPLRMVLARLEARVGISSLWQRRLVLRRIVLEDLDLAVPGSDEPGGNEIPMIPEVVRAGPVEIRIGVVELRRARIVYRDATRRQRLEIHRLDATLEPGGGAVLAALSVERLAVEAPDLSERVERISAEGRLFPDRIEIESLGLSWMGHEIQLSGGIVRPLDALALDLAVEGEVDLAALAQRMGTTMTLGGVARVGGRLQGPTETLRADLRVAVSDLVAGPVTARRFVAQGQGTVKGPLTTVEADWRISAGELTAPGPVVARQVSAQGRGILRGPPEAPEVQARITVAELATGTVTANQLGGNIRYVNGIVSLEQATAQAFEGVLAGSLVLDPARLESTHISVRAGKVSLGALEPALGLRSGVEAEIDVDGEADGDPRRPSELRGRVRLEARAVRLPGRLGRAGAGAVTAEGRFDRAMVDLSRASARWPGIEVAVKGRLEAAGARGLQLRASLDLARVGAIADQKDLGGQATVAAEMTGRWSTPEIMGRIELETPALGAVAADSLDLPFKVSGRTVRIDGASIALGASRAVTSGMIALAPDAPLGPGLRPEDVRLDLGLKTVDARLETLARWLPEAARGSGPFTVVGQIQGTVAGWRARGRAQASSLSIGTLPSIAGLDATFALTGDGIEVADFKAKVLDAPLRGAGSWAWAGSGALQAEAGPLDLSRLPGLPSGLAIHGMARATATATFKNGEIGGSSTIELERFSTAGLALGRGTGELSIQRSQLTARLAFPEARLSLAGEGPVDGPGVVTVRATATDIVLEPLVQRFAPAAQGQLGGRASATATFDIPVRDPATARGVVRIEPLHLEVAGEAFDSRRPIIVRREPGRLRVEEFEIAGRLGSMSGHARVDDTGPLEASLTGRVPLAILPALRPEIREARGTLDLDVHLSGTRERPVLGGIGNITGGLLALRDLPEPLRAIEGRLTFTPTRLRIDEIAAALGSGSVRGRGEVSIEDQGLGPYSVSVAARNITSPPIEGFESTWDADLEIVGRKSQALVRGEARLVRALYTRDLALLPLLLERPPREATAEVGREIRLQIRVLLQDRVVVRTRQAQLRAGGMLTLAGTLASPIIFGTVETREGTIKSRGHRFVLDAASARFDDPRRLDPVLDVRAHTRIRTYDVTMEIVGRLKDLTVRFSSVPPLSQEDLVTMVTFGKTRAELGASAGTVFAGEAARLLAEEVLGLEGSALSLDVLEVESSGPEGPRVTAGKRIDERTLIIYSGGYAEGGKQKLRIEYEVFGPLLLSGEQDFQGGFAGDVVLRLRFR